MNGILNAYARALTLYPKQFYDRFGSEMKEVFQSGLLAAYKQGRVLGFILRELFHLPTSLVSVYAWSMRQGDGKPAVISSVGSGGNISMNLPGESWGSSILSGLPHLLMGIILISSSIIGSKNLFASIYLPVIIFLVIFLAVIYYSVSKGWKRWSASWVFYAFFFVVILLNLGMNSISESLIGNHYWIYNLAQLILFPLVLAYFLYKITCTDRLRGILAAIPAMILIWTYFLELVPALHQSLAWGGIFLLAFIAAILILRTRHLFAALGLAMAVPILGGFPFSYLGVYQGGTLPFSEPGPSLLEAVRQYIPFVVMVLSFVLGPQLAVKLREIGNDVAKAGGKIFYRLVLGGILLGIVWALAQWMTGLSETHIQKIILQVILIGAAILYLVGFASLTWAVHQNKSPSGDISNLLELGALFLPLLFVPAVILMVFPMARGTETSSWLVSFAEIAWVFASVLVAKD